MSLIYVICSGIFVIFFVGLLKACSMARRYERERGATTTYDQFCRELAAKRGTFNNETAWAAVDKRMATGETSIIRQRHELASELCDLKQIVTTDRLRGLTAGEHELEKRSLVPTWCLSVLLLLGLMGTFLGFRQMLGNPDLREAMMQKPPIEERAIQIPPEQGQDSQFSKQQLQQYQRGMATVYQGFNGAFLPSLCGIIGTVILLIANAVVVPHFRLAMEAELDRVTERIIIPWFCTREDPVVTLAQALTSPLHKVVAQLGAVATALLASTEGAKKAVIDVQSIGSSLKDSAESLDKTFGKKSVFITGITALSQEITRFESFRETILKQLAGTNTAVEKHSTSAEGMLKELSILSKVVIQSNADSRRDLGHLVEQTKTHYETTLNQIVKAMKDTVSTFTKDTSAATSKMVHDVVVAHGKESGAAAGLMARSAEAVTKGMTQYDDALKSAREDLKSGFDSVTRQMSNINGALDKMVQRKPDIDSKIIEDGFKSAREDLKSGFDSITRQITNTNEAIDKMVQRKPDIDSKTIEDGFAAVRQMREAIHTMSERLATISDIIVRKNLEDYVRVGDPAPVAEKAPETNQSLQMGSGAGEGVTRDSPFSDATNHGSGG